MIEQHEISYREIVACMSVVHRVQTLKIFKGIAVIWLCIKKYFL